MISTDKFKKIEVSSCNQLRSWLEMHHNQKESVWLVTFKKCIPEKYVSSAQILDELLCFGWIDGIRRKLDETKTMQLISPRKAEHWALSYKVRATKLIEQGKMQAAGFKSIENSKLSGLWDFMNDVDMLIIPDDLQKALNEFSGATEFFYAINDASKRFALRWVKLAKTHKTRRSRVQELARLAAREEKLKGS